MIEDLLSTQSQSTFLIGQEYMTIGETFCFIVVRFPPFTDVTCSDEVSMRALEMTRVDPNESHYIL